MKISNPEENKNLNTLSIQVSLDGFSFYAYDKESGKYNKLIDYGTEEPESPDTILRELQRVFDENEYLSERFDNLQVVYRNELFTVVPNTLFDPEHITDYLKYNTKILSTDFIVYDALKPHDLIIVYIPFANINNFFFDYFGSFSYHHSISLFISEVLDGNVSDTKQMVVYLTDRSFDVVAHEDGKMVLVNSFAYQNSEDFLYHILFCYEQLNFNPNVEELMITGTIDEQGELYQLAQTYIRNITIVKEAFLDIPMLKL